MKQAAEASAFVKNIAFRYININQMFPDSGISLHTILYRHLIKSIR